MRGSAFALAALALQACVVPLSGAPCADHSQCPTGQLCEQGTCKEATTCASDPGCLFEGDTICDASGGVATCLEILPGCYRAGGPTACAAGKSCREGACRCPGCDPDEARCKDGMTLLACEVPPGASCGQFVEHPCATDLGCAAPEGGPARCACPAADPATTLHVDPVNARATYLPTGAHLPAACRFARLSDALAKATQGTTVLVSGADVPEAAWRPATTYPAGAMVTPTTLDGHRYRTVLGGTSGAVEPSWKPAGAVTDGTVQWEEGGALAFGTFQDEALPLDVPAGVKVLASGCAGGAACDPRAYAVVLGASASGDAAVTLGADAVLAGLSFRAAGATSRALVACSAGPAALRDLVLAEAPRTGLAVSGICNASLRRVEIRDGKGDGLSATAGTVAVEDSVIRANAASGIVVDGAVASLSSLRVHGNGAWGVSVAGASVEVAGAEIFSNGAASSGGGIGFVDAPSTLARFTGNSIHGNQRAQVHLGTRPAEGKWDLSSLACGPGINRLYCYPDGAVGLSVDSKVLSTDVKAGNLAWAHGPPTKGADFTGPVEVGVWCPAVACP